MDELKRLEDEIEYLGGEELFHEMELDEYEKHSKEWLEHKRLFGIYFRARARATHELRKKQATFASLPHA